ncbi:MAG: class I SAM-dependent methyltransferase [Paludibacteraceae bacterium]|nr:class I SAM-dependent methyltransferase [Paludibacteraceae bacterium]
MKNKAGDYYTQSRLEMLPLVPAEARRILEVGCGSGVFLRSLERDDRELWGMDINAEMAEPAREVCHRLLIGDAMQLLGELPDGYFDCIVFNDVLEHLAWPGKLLRKIRGKLGAGGCIVASIPNIRYIGVLVTGLLWHKDFCYTPEGGVLDDTHLRFFTRRSMRRLIEQSGYEVCSCQGIRPCKSWKEKLFIALSLGVLSDARYKCFAWTARLSANPSKGPEYL